MLTSDLSKGFMHFFSYLFGNLGSQKKKEGFLLFKGMTYVRLILEKGHLVL